MSTFPVAKQGAAFTISMARGALNGLMAAQTLLRNVRIHYHLAILGVFIL
jgi:hypothetical protein